MSKEAAARRYTDLSGHACAVIFSHDGKLRTFSKSTLFPFLEIGRDQPLPANQYQPARAPSLAAYQIGPKPPPEKIWVASSPRLKGKVICEQFLEQANGYRLTMLTLDDIGDDDETDEEAELGKRRTVNSVADCGRILVSRNRLSRNPEPNVSAARSSPGQHRSRRDGAPD